MSERQNRLCMNGEKTDEGKYISSYQCNPELVDLEFAQAKKEYLHKTWRQLREM